VSAPGIVVVDKPAGITSHDVVSRCRRIFGTRKVGQVLRGDRSTGPVNEYRRR
jgi:hypothetical protein